MPAGSACTPRASESAQESFAPDTRKPWPGGPLCPPHRPPPGAPLPSAWGPAGPLPRWACLQSTGVHDTNRSGQGGAASVQYGGPPYRVPFATVLEHRAALVDTPRAFGRVPSPRAWASSALVLAWVAFF